MIFQPVRYKATRLVAIVASSLLVACATGKSELTSSSPITSASIEEAQKNESLPLSSDVAGHLSSQSASQKAVRWGGTIARIQNLPDQVTSLEIVSRPLSRAGRPRHIDRTSGRFVAMVKAFLDPEIYKVGRDITVAGVLIGRQSGKVGETDYIFPVVETEAYTFWKKQTPGTQAQFPHWNSYPGHYHDPFWSPWSHRKPSSR